MEDIPNHCTDVYYDSKGEGFADVRVLICKGETIFRSWDTNDDGLHDTMQKLNKDANLAIDANAIEAGPFRSEDLNAKVMEWKSQMYGTLSSE